ncbi:MAG: NIPSNAP family protein, partial [Rhodospirillales bacterium]|nr:NIPSNAP family protein [Rhodospirillales bacterium]
MIYEHRTYRVQPGTLPKFMQLYEDKCLPVIGTYAKLIGCWATESGTLN